MIGPFDNTHIKKHGIGALEAALRLTFEFVIFGINFNSTFFSFNAVSTICLDCNRQPEAVFFA